MNKQFFLFLIFPLFGYTQINIEEHKKEDEYKQHFFRDSVLAIERWHGDDNKLDSTKTYYKSGELNELFYYNSGKFHGKSFKFNRFGEKLTTWEFNNGILINRTDHKLEFNVKNEERIKESHVRLKEINAKLVNKPNDFKSVLQRAQIRSYLGNYTLALVDFKKLEQRITKINKTQNVPEKLLANIYDHLATIYEGYEMSNYCIHYKLKAIKASPNESRLYHNLGAYLITVKSYRLGIEYLNKAIEMVPNHSFAHWVLSFAYSDLGDYEKGMRHVNIAFKNEASLYKQGLGTAERDLRTIRGFLKHKLGNSQDGITELEEALNINKNNSFALRNLGLIYYELGDYEKACDLLEQAKQLGYEKVHDVYDLQQYLEHSCLKSNSDASNTKVDTEPIKITSMMDKPYVYPNPTKDFINFKNLSFTTFNYLIFDYSGKLIIQGTCNNNSISLSYLKSGVYIVKTIKNDMVETFRVVKE